MTNQYTFEAVSGAVSLPAFTLDSRNKLLSLDRGEVIRPHAGRLPVLSTEPQPTSKLALRPESFVRVRHRFPNTSVLSGLHNTLAQLWKEVPLHNSVHIFLHARYLLPTLVKIHKPHVLVDVFPSSRVCSRNKPQADLAGLHVFHNILYRETEISKGGNNPSETLLVGGVILVR